MTEQRMFCCCISLRKACILFGVLGLLHNLKALVKFFDATKFSAEMFYSVAFILNMIFILSSVLLIVGVFAKNRFCLWQWIVVNTMGILLAVCIYGSVTVAFLWIHIGGGGEEQAEYYALIAPVVIICIVIGIYGYLQYVVYSYICELREEEKPQNPNDVFEYEKQTV